MTDAKPSEPIGLTNCDREPIHIPGSIQPHGVLLGFDAAGHLRVRSANADSIGPLPALGEAIGPAHLDGALHVAIGALLADPARFPEPTTAELAGRTWDAIFHRSGDLLIMELEARSPDAPALEGFALRAQQAIVRIQAHTSREALLEAVAVEVRALTGFDRVMVYRFQPDDSGLVEAEARREDLEPYLGLRYPASDIPAQARRLYVVSPLRLIADVSYRPVPLEPPLGPDAEKPLDLSHSVLRSVSPIHVEYLTNMGVRASMSISIVIGGRLWGLIACHHHSARLVPHAIRMACQLMAQVVSVMVERVEISRESAALERALMTQASLLLQVNAGDGILKSLVQGQVNVAELIACDGALVSLAGDVLSVGRAPEEAAARELLAFLRSRDEVMFSTSHVEADCPAVAPALGGLSGLLAIRYLREHEGFVVWFRAEERETVRWGGNPHKDVTVGPLGPRLTPRGSFEEWRETIAGRSRPFSAGELAVAKRFRHDLQDAALSRARARILSLEQRNAELDRFAHVVSHDLRAPLRAISTLSELIEEELGEGNVTEASAHTALLQGRVQRLDALIAAILDYSRAGGKKGAPRRVDLGALVRISLDLLQPPPGVKITVPPDLPVLFTHEVQLQQVLMNLLGNALKYGAPGGAGHIEVSAADRGAAWEIQVRDEGPGIAPEHRERVFDLFSRVSRDNKGTGVGLAIVRRLVEAEGGRVWIAPSPTGSTFCFLWPKQIEGEAQKAPG